MSEEHKREFTEEQLRAGEGHIGLQAGYNKGATQSGINIGKMRSVHDWMSSVSIDIHRQQTVTEQELKLIHGITIHCSLPHTIYVIRTATQSAAIQQYKSVH